MTIGIGHVVVLSTIVFGIGLGGLVTRRSAVAAVVSIGVMLLAAVIGAGGLAEVGAAGGASGASTAPALALVLAAVVACELAVGISLVLLLQRRGLSADIDATEHVDG